MRLLYFATGLLWVVLAALLVGLAAVSVDASLAGEERIWTAVILVALATPVALQLRSSHRRIREMTTNRIVLTAEGVEIQLGGRARAWKGLSDVPRVLVPWSDLLSIVRERKRFVYPSVVALGYPLDVFTLYSRAGGISFTRECVPNAGKIAREIAARVGSEI